MNCHHARKFISPYLDQQLTGREMLALQDHFAGCASCEREMQSICQVKALLRGLREPRPPRNFPAVVTQRLEQTDAHRWRALCLPSGARSPWAAPKPQRGRRLAGALVLSCVTVVSFALPFAPEAHQAAPPSSFGSSLDTGGSAFAAPLASDALLTGRMPERTMLAPVSDLAHFSSAETPPLVPSTLTLTAIDAPAAPRDAPFDTVQFAAFKAR